MSFQKFKPHTQAILKHPEQYHHVCEVLSFPFVDEDNVERIMVRRVPGIEVTLEKVPTTWLTPAQAKYKYIHFAKVWGTGYFPVDMLRYDACAPMNFDVVTRDESPYIATLLIGGMAEKLFGPEFTDAFIVAHATVTKPVFWTGARWESFGWHIEPIKTIALKDL